METIYISRSQKKRDAENRQKLGEKLAALSEEQLKRFHLPDELSEALREARMIKSHGARRRQMQRIGNLMRSVDPEPIQSMMDQVDHLTVSRRSSFHQLEHWRDQLIAHHPGTLNTIAESYPGVDFQYVRQLIRNAAKEKKQRKTPKSARLLFQYLRELTEKTSPHDIIE